MKKDEEKKLKEQLHISSRKTIEERGAWPRSVAFEDKKAKQKKYAARSNSTKKAIKEFED